MTGALTWARLSYRQQKWELLLVVVAALGAAVGMVWFAATLTSMRETNPDCLAGVAGGFVGAEQQPRIACEAITSRYYETEGMASTLLNAAWAAPFVMGVILGAPLVAREIDGRTAQMSWSLSRSRTVWLLRRVAFVIGLGVVLLAVLAVTSELLAAAIVTDRPLDEDFTWHGRRGLLVVARGLGAMAIGVLVGALIGRVLPAVLAAGIVIALVFTAVSFGLDQWNRAEAVLERRFLQAMEPAQAELSALGVAYGIETTEGEFLTYNEAYDRGLDPSYSGANGEVYSSEADMLAGRSIGYDAFLIIPGERYGEVVLRDSAVAVLLGAAAMAAASLVVTRRRPV